MIEKLTCFTLVCDGCGKAHTTTDFGTEHFETEDDAAQSAEDAGWYTYNNTRYYCGCSNSPERPHYK